MTTLLAIDTATGPCSVALWHDGRIAAYLERTQMPVMQSACLLPMIEQALAENRLAYGDLTAVAVTVGPGSFTGIRIALAAARGIAFAAGCGEMGFTTLEAMAFAAKQHAPSGSILAILNAGKGEVYYQYFAASPWHPLGLPTLGTLEEAISVAGTSHVTVAGNVVIADARFTASPITFPRADALAELAASQPSALALKPFYIRPPDAKLPSKNKSAQGADDKSV